MSHKVGTWENRMGWPRPWGNLRDTQTPTPSPRPEQQRVDKRSAGLRSGMSTPLTNTGTTRRLFETVPNRCQDNHYCTLSYQGIFVHVTCYAAQLF